MDMVRIDGYNGNYPYMNASDGGQILLDPHSQEEGMAEPLCDPYGHLTWAVGSSEDFVCFDYSVLNDGRVYLEATVNSETGSFIQSFGQVVVPAAEAEEAAKGMAQQAMDWCSQDYDAYSPRVELSIFGWNQDPYYFARCIADDLQRGRGSYSAAVPKIVDDVLYDLSINEDQICGVQMLQGLQARLSSLGEENRKLRKEIKSMKAAEESKAVAGSRDEMEEVLFSGE